MSDETLQLEAARYAFHKVTKHKYQMAVGRYEIVSDEALTEQQAGEMYTRAMVNYDGVIANAASGNSREANNKDMAMGFGSVPNDSEQRQAYAIAVDDGYQGMFEDYVKWDKERTA